MFVLELMDNVKIITYTEAAKRLHIDFTEFLKNAPSKHGFTIKDKINNKFLVFYNECKNYQTVKFTLAHELGHILLGHNNDDGDIENKEADCFARNFLCSIPIIDALDIYDCEKYSFFFDVSEPMAKVSVKYRYCDLKNISDYNYLIVKYQFESRQSTLKNLS